MYNKNTYDNLYSILRNNKIDDLHSVFDVSKGYTMDIIVVFSSVVGVNLLIWTLVVNIYEKRILKKYLTLVEEK